VEIGFDGAEGFELAVPLTVFGSPRNAPFMRLWRALARKLARKGVGGVDLNAYRPDRLLRLPNSRNSETGLYVCPLEFKELQDFSAVDIRDLVAKPWDFESVVIGELSWKAAAWFDRAVASVVRAKPSPPSRRWCVPRCIRRLKSDHIPDRLRPEAYFLLARLYVSTGMHPEEGQAGARSAEAGIAPVRRKPGPGMTADRQPYLPAV